MKWIRLFMLGLLIGVASAGAVSLVIAVAMFFESSEVRSFVQVLVTAFGAMGFAAVMFRSDFL